MNIEKIKNYNQKMLALVSTLGAILLLIFIIMMIKELHLFGGHHYYNNPSGLIADDKVENLNQENQRKQIISYESPWLIDTLKSVYIVPVSITTLMKPEEIPPISDGVMSLLDTYPSFSKSKEGYYNKRYFEGSYANLILYYPLENKTLSLFNERILIGSVQAYYFKEDILLVFYSAEKDTDKDGIIDLNDARNLCIYSLNKGILKKISDGDNSVEKYQFIENTKDLLVEFSLNQYKEKQFTGYRTPCKIMKYSYETQELVDIIPQKIQENMQKLVEGKSNPEE
jgi:hypothetical protein